MSPEQRINAERIKTILTIHMSAEGQKETAAAAELRSDEITRSRHAIPAIAAVLASKGYDVLSQSEVRVAGALQHERMGKVVLQQALEIQALKERIAELEGVTQ